MYDSQNFHSRKRNSYFGILLLVFSFVICVAFSSGENDDFNSTRTEILLRRIGHEILLQSGDSTSRVLPIKKIAKNEYQISFEHALTFQPDALISATRRFLDNAPLSSSYIVTVLKCENATIVYGYAISKHKKDDIVPCKGRRQPKACYIINIQFKPTEIQTAYKGYLLGSLSLLAIVGFVFIRSVKPRKPLVNVQDSSIFVLGAVLFDAKNRKLILHGNAIDLTITETRVLLIFAASPNQTIERSRLQKEIWEDEGVVVGRSLDMFISKLRKKLEIDASIKIVVIRGKGYKLEIESHEKNRSTEML